MTTFNVEYLNKHTNSWGVAIEGYKSLKAAEKAAEKQRAKFPTPVRVVEAVPYNGPFQVGSKVRVTSISQRSDGLVDKQVVIAVVTKNNGDRAEYEVVEHEVEENVLRKLKCGGFCVGMAHLANVKAI